MTRGWFEGWRGVLVTAVVGTALTAAALAALLLATSDDVGLDESVFDERGAVALPGRLECALPGDAAATGVRGPVSATAAVALSGGEVLVAGQDGRLWRGEPATGALEPWGRAVEGVTALGRSPLPDHVFAAGPEELLALDVHTGEVVSRRPLPPDAGRVVGVTAGNRSIHLLTADGEVLRAEWAYDALGEVAPLDADEPLPPLTAALTSPDGEVLLGAAQDGPLRRLSLVNGRLQDLPVGQDVDAPAMTRGPGGLVYLGNGSDLRVLDLNERWVTGRLSGAVDGWDAPVAALTGTPDGLLVTGPAGQLTLVPYPRCNREELTRLEEQAG